jgi:hypothetical protein
VVPLVVAAGRLSTEAWANSLQQQKNSRKTCGDKRIGGCFG